jgi:hypothetical protein
VEDAIFWPKLRRARQGFAAYLIKEELSVVLEVLRLKWKVNAPK